MPVPAIASTPPKPGCAVRCRHQKAGTLEAERVANFLKLSAGSPAANQLATRLAQRPMRGCRTRR